MENPDSVEELSGTLTFSVPYHGTDYTVDYDWFGSPQNDRGELTLNFNLNPEMIIFSHAEDNCGVFSSYAEMGSFADEILKEAEKINKINVSVTNILFFEEPIIETTTVSEELSTTTVVTSDAYIPSTAAPPAQEFESAVTIATAADPNLTQNDIAKVLISFVDENTGNLVNETIKAEIVYPDNIKTIGFDTRWGNSVVADLVPDSDGYTLRVDALPAGYTYHGESFVAYGIFGTLAGTQKIEIPLTIDESATTVQTTTTEATDPQYWNTWVGTHNTKETTGTTAQYTSAPPDVPAEITTAVTGDYLRDENGGIVIINGTSAVFTDNTSSTTTTVTVTKTETAEEPPISGDLNQDSEIDIRDIIMINQSVFGKISLTDAQKQAADIDKNGIVDAEDALAVMKYIVRIIDTL